MKKNNKKQNLATWYNFTVQQENLFIRNDYSCDDLLKIEKLKTFEMFYKAFEYFLSSCCSVR